MVAMGRKASQITASSNPNITHPIFQDNNVWAGKQVFLGDVVFAGNITQFNEVSDYLILNGRVATGSAAGSALAIDSDYSYGEGQELRYQVTDWTNVGSSFKGIYLRSECATNTASGKDVYGMEVLGVSNNVATGNVWGALIYAYAKGSGARTITTMYAVQPELSWDASSSTTTITTEAVCVRAKITGGKVDDYTKIHGYQLKAGDMNGASVTYGYAFHVLDDTGMSGTISWTTGIYLQAACTTGIHLADTGSTSSVGYKVVNGYLGKAIKIGSLSSTTPGSGNILDDTTTRAVEVNADDNNSSLNTATLARAIMGRYMIYANVTNENWGIDGLLKWSGVAHTANVNAGVTGRFETTGTCSSAVGAGNSYIAGVMGRIGFGSGMTLGAGTYAACVLAFGNTQSGSITGTTYHAFHAALTDVGTAEVFDVGLYIEDSAATKGIYVGSATTGIDIGTAATGLTFSGTYTTTAIQVGTSGSPIALAANDDHLVDIYATTDQTGASIEPFALHTTLTGAGAVGGRALFYMTADVALGGWSNALKAHVVYGSSGSTSGMGSALCAELQLSAGTTSGTYAPLESEVVVGGSGSLGTATSFLYCNCDATGEATFNAGAFLFELGSNVNDGAGNLWDTTANLTNPQIDGSLKIKIDGATKYIPVMDNANGS